jgi:hypothetical protein
MKHENNALAAIPKKHKIITAGMVASAHFTINLTIAVNGISILEICTFGACFPFNLFIFVLSILISPFVKIPCLALPSLAPPCPAPPRLAAPRHASQIIN